MPATIILAGPGDPGAGEVFNALQERGGEVLFLTPRILEVSRWCHEFSARGDTMTHLTLPDGRQLPDHDIGAVLNRWRQPSVRRFARSSRRDRDYALAEWQALLVSWLDSLGRRVVGRVDGQGSALDQPSSFWADHGAHSGFRTEPLLPGRSEARRQGQPGVNLTVVGSDVYANAEQLDPRHFACVEPAVALAQRVGAALLGLVLPDLASSTLLGVDPWPSLSGLGSPVGDLLAVIA